LIIIGIDEAGRGPLIGDMFVAGVALDSNVCDKLITCGVKDSKLLTPPSRYRLFNVIVDVSYFIYVRRYQPERIDSSNINNLFIEAVKSCIKTILKLGIKPSAIYVDSPSCGRRLIKTVKPLIGNSIDLVVEFNADRKYVVVAAASIVAKVLRDSYIHYLRTIYGDFGSGYPSDPKTIKWIEGLIANGSQLPPIVRRSWKTIRRLNSYSRDLTYFIRKSRT